MTRIAPMEELSGFFTDWEAGVLNPPPDDFWCETYARLEGDTKARPAEVVRRRARSKIRRTFKEWQAREPSRAAYRVVINEARIHGLHKTRALPGLCLTLQQA